ncbi:reverse transcriptase domain-containing protein [Trichonephila clavipes]|nr:reverse transcriptase domain-containing protein [Trichonephila clavipes]
MANNLPTIPAFEAGTNPSKSWRHWKEDFEDYLEALRYSEAAEKIKTALFRHLCGELKNSYELLTLSLTMVDRLLQDKLIQGLLDKALQERLIRETSKKARALQEVVSECKTAENSKVQASVMNEKFTVNALKNFKNYRKQSINNQKIEFNCKQCGKKHEKKKCPAFGTKCRNCEGRNHWAKMCRTQSKQKNTAARRVNAMEENSENSDIIYVAAKAKQSSRAGAAK